jgi:tetratricopeptide (TPR) repeat protein
MNNLQPATVNWFFSYAWTAPLVIIVLIAFACGAVFGVLAMTPSWWRHRRAARRLDTCRRLRRAPRPCRGRRFPTRRWCAMDSDYQWFLLALPLFFILGWVGSRFDLRQLKRETRESPKAYYKGLGLLLNEQQDKAIDAFIEAVQNDPDTSELHFALGNLFRRRGEFERACACTSTCSGAPTCPQGERVRRAARAGAGLRQGRPVRSRRGGLQGARRHRLSHRGAARAAEPLRALARLARGDRCRTASREAPARARSRAASPTTGASSRLAAEEAALAAKRPNARCSRR